MTMGSDAYVSEEIQIAIRMALQAFINDPDLTEYEFPSSFSSEQRKFVHKTCGTLGLKTKSKGRNSSRYVTAYKKNASTLGGCDQSDVTFCLANSTKQSIIGLLQTFPVSLKDRQDVVVNLERERILPETPELNRPGRLSNGIPQVPPAVLARNVEAGIGEARQQLPIAHCKSDIMSLIRSNRVVLISGETGSGKTTQVPQFILEECVAQQQPCRVFCTQPRRIAAVSVAERVAAERGEKIGDAVGYQIRLESKVSPKTLLFFCTNGVLLRTLTSCDTTFGHLTHIIVDEIHERDRYSDFLLTVLRYMMNQFRNLKVILMSANLDVEHLLEYFACAGAVHYQVPGRCFEVKEFYLEDVLLQTGFMGSRQRRSSPALPCTVVQELQQPCVDATGTFGSATMVRPEVDSLLSRAWKEGSESLFDLLYHGIISDSVDVNYQHSENGATALMVAAGRDQYAYTQSLLELGARVSIKACNGWTAIDWARQFASADITELLETYAEAQGEVDCGPSKREFGVTVLSAAEQNLLDSYHATVGADDRVDCTLVISLLDFICTSHADGAILVFLAGYDDIIALRDQILAHKRFADTSRYSVYTLHSNMQSMDQKRVFHHSQTRKLILATNIAETSLTIPGVIFVIDTGRMKEKSFDSFLGASCLRTVWVSRANAEQRRGRAGRCAPGVCYRLYSKSRFQNMARNQVPEMLRIPIYELCLQAKLLAPHYSSVIDFLSLAPDPPSSVALRNAVQFLKTVEAMDDAEELTELGFHLAELPLEPPLAKMVLFSVVLKCLDPVLTIASCLAYREPFVLPNSGSGKLAAQACRSKLSANTFSDHVVLLRAFQAWQKARTEGWERQFCERNFLNPSSMEMIVGIRTQLLGHLRAAGFVRARGAGDIRDLNCNSDNWAVVKAALTAGCYPAVAYVDRRNRRLMTQRDSNVFLHPSTVLASTSMNGAVRCSRRAECIAQLPTDWLLYHEMIRVGRHSQLRCVSSVTALTVCLFAGPSRLQSGSVRPTTGADAPINGDWASDSEPECNSEQQQHLTGGDQDGVVRVQFKLDEWLCFTLGPDVCGLTLQLRQKFHALLLRRLRGPSKPWSQMDEAVLQTVISVLNYEESAAGLVQPMGIGQRPKPMSAEYLQASQVPLSGGNVFSLNGAERREFGLNVNGFLPSDCIPTAANSAYFVVTCYSMRQANVSATKKVFAASSLTERRLFSTFKGGKAVFLLFVMPGTDHFIGYARMVSTAFMSREKIPEFTGQKYGTLFNVHWLKRAELPFVACGQLLAAAAGENMLDGFELDSASGARLLEIWETVSLPRAGSCPYNLWRR